VSASDSSIRQADDRAVVAVRRGKRAGRRPPAWPAPALRYGARGHVSPPWLSEVTAQHGPGETRPFTASWISGNGRGSSWSGGGGVAPAVDEVGALYALRRARTSGATEAVDRLLGIADQGRASLGRGRTRPQSLSAVSSAARRRSQLGLERVGVSWNSSTKRVCESAPGARAGRRRRRGPRAAARAWSRRSQEVEAGRPPTLQLLVRPSNHGPRARRGRHGARVGGRPSGDELRRGGAGSGFAAVEQRLLVEAGLRAPETRSTFSAAPPEQHDLSAAFRGRRSFAARRARLLACPHFVPRKRAQVGGASGVESSPSGSPRLGVIAWEARRSRRGGRRWRRVAGRRLVCCHGVGKSRRRTSSAAAFPHSMARRETVGASGRRDGGCAGPPSPGVGQLRALETQAVRRRGTRESLRHRPSAATWKKRVDARRHRAASRSRFVCRRSGLVPTACFPRSCRQRFAEERAARAAGGQRRGPLGVARSISGAGGRSFSSPGRRPP